MIAAVLAEISFAEKPTITGELVVQRPVGVADAPALLSATLDPEVNRLTGTARPSGAGMRGD